MQNIKYNMYNNTDAPWEDVLSLVARTNMDFIAENKNETEFKQAYLISAHWIQGMVDGVNKKSNDVVINDVDVFLMNAQGDIEDLEALYEETRERYDWKIQKGQWHSCSGSIRHSPSFDDVWFSQDTWTSFYSGFIRIAKTY